VGDFMQKNFDVIIEKDQDGFYIATVPALKGCYTQAKSLDTLMERVKEVIELCLETEETPITTNDFIGVQRVAISA
jgi:predicted RNase H-like HicB family nuclease